jgi:hypothetical protein
MTIPNPLSPINPRSATRVGGALKPFSGQVILAVKPRRLLRASRAEGPSPDEATVLILGANISHCVAGARWQRLAF